MSAAIVHDQDVLWGRGYGLADVESRRPAAPDTIYSICSISKLFTSVAVMQQRDAGRLRLDDPVEQHLPWFKIRRRGGGRRPSRSGHPDARLGPAARVGPRLLDRPRVRVPDARPDHRARLEPADALPRRDVYYQYSNLGLTLAGEIAAAAAGQPYAELVRKDILEPLGLPDTDARDARRRRGAVVSPPATRPRARRTREPVPFFTADGIAPAAGYASTVEDLGALRVVAVPPPQEGRNRGPRRDHASRDAARALDRPGLRRTRTGWASPSGAAATRPSSGTAARARASERSCCSIRTTTLRPSR